MKIITISRQYGAGGREIGLAVGKELGVTLYDRDIIAATAKASSIDASQIEREGEEISATENILRNITPISYDQKDYIYETQRSVILDLAKQGPCVIPRALRGRCAARRRDRDAECVHLFRRGAPRRAYLRLSEHDRHRRDRPCDEEEGPRPPQLL